MVFSKAIFLGKLEILSNKILTRCVRGSSGHGRGAGPDLRGLVQTFSEIKPHFL